MSIKKSTKKESKKGYAKNALNPKTQNGKQSLKSKQKEKDKRESSLQKNGVLDYEKLSKALLEDKEKYVNEKFKDCWPTAKIVSETITNTVWDDSMKIMQDYPSTYAQTASVCFFSFLCSAIDAYLEKRYSKNIEEKDLPAIESMQVADSEIVKTLVERSEKELSIDGHLLLKNLIQRDFGYLFAVLKALNIENTALHNLLISNFRFWVWDVMVPHLFLSEKKKEEAHA